MTQYFLGLDLGCRNVKAVLVKQGLKDAEVVGYDMEPVSVDNGTDEDTAMAMAARDLLDRFSVADATIFCSVPGEWVSTHRLSLPVSAVRQARDVISFELDELLPYDIDECVFGFVEMERGEQVSYLVCAIESNRAASLLDALMKQRIDPVLMTPAPLAYQQYFQVAGDVIWEETGVVALVDVGHQRTNVVVLGDDTRTSQTILRGGAFLDEKLAREKNVTMHAAVEMKERHGMAHEETRGVLESGLTSIVRDIGRTLAGHVANGGKPVDRVWLCGGGAALSGIESFVSHNLDIPVIRYDAAIYKDNVPPLESEIRAHQMVLANCLAWLHLVPRARQLNFRVGALAQNRDTDVLRRRTMMLCGCVLLILVAWMFSGIVRYRAMKSYAAQNRESLEALTEYVLGEKTITRKQIENEMVITKENMSIIPERDAFDILVEMSSRIPESVVHDVEEIDIKPKRIKIMGIVDSTLLTDVADAEDVDLSPTDLIKKKLAEFDECFLTFRIPRVNNLGARQKYTMEIDSRCP